MRYTVVPMALTARGLLAAAADEGSDLDSVARGVLARLAELDRSQLDLPGRDAAADRPAPQARRKRLEVPLAGSVT